MEEDDIVVSLCILLIASAALRIKQVKQEKALGSFSHYLNSLPNFGSKEHLPSGTIHRYSGCLRQKTLSPGFL